MSRVQSGHEKFQERGSAELSSKGFEAVLRDSMISALRNILGEGGMNAVLFHTGLNKTNDIQVIHQKLSSLFAQGTPVLERAIVKELFAEIKIPYNESDQFNFTNELGDAQKRFVNSVGERRIS